MKKLIFVIAAIMMVALVAGCGGHKSDLAMGNDLFKEDNCAEAVPYFDASIENTKDIMELAHAYFLKGMCAEKSGDMDLAYEKVYSAKVVACYAVANNIQASLNTYARSEFCQKIIPDMLKKMEDKVSDPAAIRKLVDEKLHARYMEKFVSK